MDYYSSSSSEANNTLFTTTTPDYLLGRLLSQRPSQLPGKVELCRGGSYAISYEPTMLNPHYSTWKITTAQARSYISGRDSFIQDPDLKSLKVPQANASSNVWSVEWNRGHLAPSRMLSFSIWSKEETYYYSNVAPQWWYFNQQPWETLEQNLFEWVRDRNDTVLYITTGVEYFPWRRINNSFVRNDSVAMPDYYFTAICDVASGESAAFIGPNKEDNSDMLQRYRTVREVELEIFGTGGTLFDRQLCRTTSPVNVSHWSFGGYVSNAAAYGSTPSIQDAINISIWLPGINWHRWVPSATPTTLSRPQEDLCTSVASPCMGLPDCQKPPSPSNPAPSSNNPLNITKLASTYVSNATIIRDLLTNTLRTVLTTAFGWDYFGFMFEVPFLVANVTSASINSSSSPQSPVGIALRLTINFNRTLMVDLASRATAAQLSPTDYIAGILNGTRLVALETWYKSQGADATVTSLNTTVRTPADCTVSPTTTTTPTTTPTTTTTTTTETTASTTTATTGPAPSTTTAITSITTQSPSTTTMTTQKSTTTAQQTSTTTSQSTAVTVVSTSTTTTSAPTTTTTTTTTSPPTTTTTTTHPPSLTYIDFNITTTTTSNQLQGMMNAYNGTVLLPCRSNADTTKTCKTSFGNATNAIIALDAANAQSFAGVTGAAVGSAPSTDSPISDEDEDSDGPPWPLVGGVLAAVVVLIALVVGTVVLCGKYKRSSSSSRGNNVDSMYQDDSDEYGMNMPTLNSSVMMQDEI